MLSSATEMILHTVNKSPLHHRALGSCLQFFSAGDALVLLEDGVYAGITGVDCGLDQFSGDVFAIAADVEARGLASRMSEHLKLISYGDFVELCTDFGSIKNWS